MIVETELASTVCTGLGGIGWGSYGNDGCVVETYAFTERDGVVCYCRRNKKEDDEEDLPNVS